MNICSCGRALKEPRLVGVRLGKNDWSPSELVIEQLASKEEVWGAAVVADVGRRGVSVARDWICRLARLYLAIRRVREWNGVSVSFKP